MPNADWNQVVTPALLALSGGGDSVALLHLARQSQLDFRVIHVQHGEAVWQQKAANFVSDLCNQLRIPFDIRMVTVHGFGGVGFEAKARKLRYAAISEVCLSRGCRSLLTAHTLDDQAETVAIALHRRQGIAAQAGIPKVRGLQLPNGGTIPVVRPLLGCSRQELRDWLREIGRNWIEDPSNGDPEFCLRNRIRSDLSQLSKGDYEAQVKFLLDRGRQAQERLDWAILTVDGLWGHQQAYTCDRISFNTKSVSDLDEDALQALFLKLGRHFGVEAGGFSRGERLHFMKLLHENRWGSRGDFKRRIEYRITKTHCTFSPYSNSTGS